MKNGIIAATAAIALAGVAVAEGDIVDVSVDGVESWDLLDDDSNNVLTVDVAAGLGLPSGTPVEVTGVGWDVTIETVGASWISEADIAFYEDSTADADFFTLGIGDLGEPGIASYASAPIKLGDAGLPNLVLESGVLQIQFYESFDDVADEIDALWSGSLQIQAIPAPGALALIGLAGIAGRRRRA